MPHLLASSGNRSFQLLGCWNHITSKLLCWTQHGEGNKLPSEKLSSLLLVAVYTKSLFERIAKGELRIVAFNGGFSHEIL